MFVRSFLLLVFWQSFSVYGISHDSYVKRLNAALKAKKSGDFYRFYKDVYVKSCNDLMELREKEKFLKLRRLNAQLRFNELLEKNKLTELSPILKLLLKDEEMWLSFVEQVEDKDDLVKVLDNLGQISKLDSKDFKEYFALALAVSVVWDVPRPVIHKQIGRMALTYNNRATDVYSYFKKIYDTRKAALRYRELSVRDLIYVVNTPVPIEELEWALKEVRGKAKRWGSHYSAIQYDTPRLAANQFTWPQYNGDYSMENIKEYGGICVDQAYYTVMSARAHGIPAMYFEGTGRGGGHAWAGVFLDENDWETEIGRYSQDNYAVGHTVNPQTDEELSDHELELSCNRKYFRSSYIEAKPYVVAAEKLLKLNKKNVAFKYASYVKQNASLYEQSWLVIEEILKGAKKIEELHALYKAKLRLFKKYPDIYAKTEKSYALWLLSIKDREGAEKILKKSFKKGKEDRIDLLWQNVLAFYKIYEEDKNLKDASEVLEDFIYENYKEMSNIFPALYEYYDFAKRNNLGKDACSFMKKAYSKMISSADELNREELMSIMIKFYQLAGDKRGEAKVKKDLDKVQEKKAKEAERSKRKDKRRQQEDSYYPYE